MVQGISGANQNVGYVQPAANTTQPQSYAVAQEPTADQFVAQIKKAKTKAIVGGTTLTIAALLAAIGGTFMKTKWGRALSVIPAALTTLGVGLMTFGNAKKMNDLANLVQTLPKDQV